MNKADNFSYDDLKDICENSKSYKEIAQKLGYSNYGGAILKTIKKIINDNNFQLNLQTKTKEQKDNQKEELIGKSFGRLTILEIDKEKTKQIQRIYYLCRCSCDQHTIVSVRKDQLLNKQHPTQSCGCLSKEFGHKQGIKNREDLTGYITDKLTVINYNKDESNKHNRPYWNVRCQCGREYAVSATVIKRGQSSCGCEKSNGELKVSKILQSLNIDFVQQYTFNDLYGNSKPLSFDFYLSFKNILIEYQGQQHYKPVEFFGGKEQFITQQRYDNLKREYCKTHNIKLIEIPYWDYDKIDEDYLQALLK